MKFKIFFSFIFFLLFTTSQILALENLYYYKEEKRSRESFFENVSKRNIENKIDILGPQTYFLKYGGEIKGEVQKDVLNEAKKYDVKVMPLLANIIILPNGKESFDMNLMKDLLNDKKNWEKVIKFMKEEGKKNNFYGWQLDLEHLHVEDKDKFLEFVKFLKTELDKDNLKLSAAIVSKISDNPRDYSKFYWDQWAGAYDYAELGKILDFVSVMAYDEPYKKGPVATIGWSEKVLKYTLTKIPKEKVSFGIPTYSWAYRSDDLKNKKSHFRMVDYGVVEVWMKQFEKQKTIKLSKDAHQKAYKSFWATGMGESSLYGDQIWISYNLNSKNYTIWAEGKNAFWRKYNLAKQNRVRGVSVWVLGDEDKKIWEI